jgi:hypothetical protein
MVSTLSWGLPRSSTRKRQYVCPSQGSARRDAEDQSQFGTQGLMRRVAHAQADRRRDAIGDRAAKFTMLFTKAAGQDETDRSRTDQRPVRPN